MDLRQISISDLTDYYLTFVSKAEALRVELNADYLLIAAWLALLMSRLLLPPDPTKKKPSVAELAVHLTSRLERLKAIRLAAIKLMKRDKLGRDIFSFLYFKMLREPAV